jgi:hypothetical protein
VADVVFESVGDITIESRLVPGVDERNEWDLLRSDKILDGIPEHGYQLLVSLRFERALGVNEEDKGVHLVVLDADSCVLVEDLSVPSVLEVDPRGCLAESKFVRICDRQLGSRPSLSGIEDERIVLVSS